MKMLKGFMIFAAIAVLLMILFWKSLSGGYESGERLFINSVVMNFNDVKDAAEAAVKFRPGIINANEPQIQRSEVKTVQISGANEILFGQKGDVIVISEKYGRVIILKPLLIGTKRWSCYTYPKVSFKSLCESKEQ